ncbi:MAG: hypothetical protein M3N19_10315, partial [Candidatus Eremiobacteraeota bacterium]|nr:hypothetical protein [Candidatus Eremiobacteraeota bacterium]
ATHLPLLVLATYRSEETAGAHPLRTTRRELQLERRASSITLKRLDVGEVGSLTRQVSGLHAASPSLVDWVFRLSEGNPLFAWQLLRGYAETGEVPDESTALKTVRDAIVLRIDRLKPEVRAVADLAAMVGREFTADIVSDAGGWDETVVLDALSDLMDRHIVRESSAPGFQYAFTHSLIAGAIYDQTPERLRKQRHHRIGAVLEQSRGDDPSMLGPIAGHWKLAGDNERARKAYLQAAHSALELFARDEAIRFARESYALSATDPDRFAALRLAARAGARYSPPHSWKRDIDELERIAAEIGDVEHFEALELREDFLLQTGDRDAEFTTIQAMLELATRMDSKPRRVHALNAMGLFYVFQGVIPKAVGPLREALAIAESIGDVVLATKARMRLAQALMRSGAIDEGAHLLEVQRQHPEGFPMVRDRLGLVGAESALAFAREDGVLAARAGQEMLEIGRQIGDADAEAKGHCVLAFAAQRHFNVAEAVDHSEQAERLLESLGDIQAQANIVLNRAEYLFDVGQVEEAHAQNERARLILTAGEWQVGEGYYLLLRAKLERSAREFDAARETAAAAFALARETGEGPLFGASLSVLGSSEYWAGLHEAGITHMHEGIEHRRSVQAFVSMVDDLCTLTEALLDSGRLSEAQAAACEIQSYLTAEPARQKFPERIVATLTAVEQAARSTAVS